MRLTVCLCKQSQRWLLKQSWLKRGRIRQPRTKVPYFLEERDIKVVEANEIEEFPSEPEWVPPVPDDPRFAPKKTIQDHPEYKEIPIYSFSTNTCLIEGLEQVCLLTKSKPMSGLPASVQELVGVVSVPDQDELAQRIIMQANRWDPEKEKIIRAPNPELPIWKYKAEWGIPKRRRIKIMLNGLFRLCGQLAGMHTTLLTHKLVTNPYLSTQFNFYGNTPIQIQGMSEFMTYTKQPLGAFGDTDTVDSTVSHKLPDLYPLAPTIDLHREHVYREENITSWLRESPYQHPHTLAIADIEDSWTQSQKDAVATMFCFGHCVATAKNLYGWDVTSLPEPISMQCIQTDGATFSFVFFQLNTLNTSSPEGIKNLVWLDSNNALYKRLEPKRSMLRNTKYEDYDPEVLKKIFALYMNGGS